MIDYDKILAPGTSGVLATRNGDKLDSGYFRHCFMLHFVPIRRISHLS